MNQALIESRLADVRDLPSLPVTAMTLLQLLSDPETEIDDISKTMARDPALTATVLRIVNSSYYGLRNKVAGLPLALSILGYRTVENIVLTAAAAGVFRRKNVTPQFSPQAFAKHSIAAAAVCRFLARFSKDLAPDLAFSVGLLHDIGKLAMDQCFPAEYTMAVERARSLSIAIHKAEEQVWGCNHATVGCILARHWKLPDELCESIAHHHDLAGAPNRKRIACCYMADYVCAVKSLSTPDRFTPAELDREAWNLLRLDPRVLPDLLGILDQEIQEASLMFSAASADLVTAH
jgi:putative nucleotidyltransferase with HDIG domain